MYKIMIVDDEPIIRYAVKACIRWEDDRLQFAGDYANGLTALQALDEQEVHILFTDIKMPVMDGLELTKLALQRSPGMKVILISGYNDFEFVRQGIVLGAVDYIQKSTMEPGQLAEVIDRAIEQIEQQQEVRRSLDQLQRTKRETARRKGEQDLKKLLARSMTEADYAAVRPPGFEGGYTMIAAGIKGTGELREKHGYLYVSMLLDELQERFYKLEPEGLSILTNSDAELLLVLPHRPDAEEAAKGLKRRLEAEAGVRLTFVYADSEEPRQWLQQYERLREIAELCFFHTPGGLFACADASQGGWAEAASASAAYSRTLPENLPDAVRHAIETWSSGMASVARIKKEACELLADSLQGKVEPPVLMAYNQQMMRSETLDDVVQLLASDLLGDEELPQDALADNATAQLIEKAKAYIDEHYNEDLTLQMVANHVHVSRNYFSLLYKKQTNLNFIDYLIQLRIQKAKELLRKKQIKVYEVARESGFNDVKYFSKLFKKITGCSPLEFREQQLEEA